jgi:hypothetical protein
MSGRRRTGALATGLNTLTTLVGSKFEAGQKEEAAQKDFQRRLVEAGVKQGLESGQIQPQFQNGQMTGFAQSAQQPMNLQGLLQGQGNGLSPYNIKPKFDKWGNPAGYDTEMLTPQQQVQQQQMKAHQDLQQAQAQAAPVLESAQAPQSFGMGERAMEGRPAALGRATDLAQAPVQQAQNRLDQANQLSQAITPQVPITTYVQGQGMQTLGTMQKGGKFIPPNPEERKAKFEATNALTTIEQVFASADRLIPADQSGPRAVVGGFGRQLGAASGLDENARAFEQYKEGVLSITIRGLGERGVLTDQDVQRARMLLPAFGDSAVVRQTKKQELMTLLQSRLAQYGGEQRGASEEVDPLGLR